jgi:hypothetical protein
VHFSPGLHRHPSTPVPYSHPPLPLLLHSSNRQAQLAQLQQGIEQRDREVVAREGRIASLQHLLLGEGERAGQLEATARALEADIREQQGAVVGAQAVDERVEALRRAVAAEARVTVDLTMELTKLRDASRQP